MGEITIVLAKEELRQELEEFLVFNNGESVRELAHKYISCMFSNDYRKPTFIIALKDNKIIGTAAYSEEIFTVNTWGISWVSVHPEHRNQGIGQQLVETCLTKIKEEAKQSVTAILGTYPNKTRLYEKAGFKKAGQDEEGGSYMLKILKIERTL